MRCNLTCVIRLSQHFTQISKDAHSFTVSLRYLDLSSRFTCPGEHRRRHLAHLNLIESTMASNSVEIDGKASEVAHEDVSKSQTASWDSEAEKKLRRKCDRHVLPCITLLFFMSFLDRTNIGEKPRAIAFVATTPKVRLLNRHQATRGSREW